MHHYISRFPPPTQLWNAKFNSLFSLVHFSSKSTHGSSKGPSFYGFIRFLFLTFIMFILYTYMFGTRSDIYKLLDDSTFDNMPKDLPLPLPKTAITETHFTRIIYPGPPRPFLDQKGSQKSCADDPGEVWFSNGSLGMSIRPS